MSLTKEHAYFWNPNISQFYCIREDYLTDEGFGPSESTIAWCNQNLGSENWKVVEGASFKPTDKKPGSWAIYVNVYYFTDEETLNKFTNHFQS
jgi:hypothetical protein